MNNTVRAVASLFAALILACASAASFAQQTEEARVHEFTRVDSFACPGQGTIAGSSIFLLIDDKTVNTFGSFFPAGSPERTLFSTFPTELALMRNGGALLDQVIGQWRATGRSFSAWVNPAHGRIAVERIFVPQICSHNFAARVQQFGGQSVANILGQANSPFRSDGVRFYVQSPDLIQFQGQAKKYPICRAGTQPLYLGTAGPKHRSFSNWVEAQQFSASPGWSQWNVWEDVFPGEGVTCIPTEVGKVWVNNDYPSDVQRVMTDVGGVLSARNRGSFVTRFTLDATPSVPNIINHLQSWDNNRQNSFDNSRDVFYTPAFNPLIFITARNAVAPATGVVESVVTSILRTRLGVYAHERTGRTYQLTSFIGNNSVLVSNPNQALDLNPKVLTAGLTNDDQVEANVGALMEGDLFFQVLSTDSYSKSLVKVFDLRLGDVGQKVAEYSVAFPLAEFGGTNAALPSLAFDAKRGELYILNFASGRLFALNVDIAKDATPANTGDNAREVVVANQGGDNLTGIALDVSNDKLYVLAVPTLGGNRRAANRFTYGGRLMEQSITSGAALREVVTGSPRVVTLGNVQGKLFAFVANVADNTLWEVDVSTMLVTRTTLTEQQPIAISLQFKD